jgi:DNA-directed RNA polymerase subunit RPC12/RpoP
MIRCLRCAADVAADKLRAAPRPGRCGVRYVNRCRQCGAEYSALQPGTQIQARHRARRLERAGQGAFPW